MYHDILSFSYCKPSHIVYSSSGHAANDVPSTPEPSADLPQLSQLHDKLNVIASLVQTSSLAANASGHHALENSLYHIETLLDDVMFQIDQASKP